MPGMLFDTNVWIGAVFTTHPFHAIALAASAMGELASKFKNAFAEGLPGTSAKASYDSPARWLAWAATSLRSSQ